MKPGTPEILRLLVWLHNEPAYSKKYREYRERAAVPPPRAVQAIYDLGAACILMPGCTLVIGGAFCWFVLIPGCAAAPTTCTKSVFFFTHLLAASPALLYAGSMTRTTIRIYRAIQFEYLSHRWDDMLLLPDDRYRAVLYRLSYAYSPGLLAISFMINVFVAMLITAANGTTAAILLITVLLMIEWIQFQPLSVVFGLFSSEIEPASEFIPAGLMIGVFILRAAVGFLVAGKMGYDVLLLGPMVGAAKSLDLFTGILVALIYFGILEILIRTLFAYSLDRAGEITG
jgi:uncharacterized membrane protein YbaN (DUF454 family)